MILIPYTRTAVCAGATEFSIAACHVALLLTYQLGYKYIYPYAGNDYGRLMPARSTKLAVSRY